MFVEFGNCGSNQKERMVRDALDGSLRNKYGEFAENRVATALKEVIPENQVHLRRELQTGMTNCDIIVGALSHPGIMYDVSCQSTTSSGQTHRRKTWEEEYPRFKRYQPQVEINAVYDGMGWASRSNDYDHICRVADNRYSMHPDDIKRLQADALSKYNELVNEGFIDNESIQA